MAVTLLVVLVKALKKLKESSFRRFIEKLSDWEVREKYTKIPKDDLTGKDPEHIVGLINSYYREGYGAEVTLDILEGINEKKVREELQQDLMEVDFRRQGLGTPMFTERINVIDDHRSDLIRWITDVDPLLRDLRDQKLLTQEQCYDMMEKTTNRKKMEELCDVINHLEDIEKYKAYITLRKFNERLIKNLERNDRIWRNAHSERFGDMLNFIDHYQSDLIRWLRNVKTVLRDLRDQKLLTQEQYDDVMEKPINRKKMEELCDVISHWEDAGKYKAYITLRKYNQKIITDWEMEDTVYRNSQSGCFWDHFVNRHRSHLINNIKEVNPVVDDLRTNHFLNEKEYRGLQAVTTPEDKMKHLFYIFWHKCDTVKDQFYISFWRYNYTVIDRLEKSEKLRKISIAEDRVLGENIHRLKKIKQVLHPVIDDLFFESLLTGEECDYMMEMSDMEYWERGLYTIIRDWDEDDKQKVYRSIADNLQTWEESSRLQNGDHLVSDECSKSEQTNKQPDHVMGMSQAKDKMLRLYCIISGFNDKEEFFRTLYKQSRSVTNNLKMLEDESKPQEDASCWNQLV
ncbi:uncharacterized protein [Eleutherodactylus coqui]|uniref:uncharacterized protein isoform X2 n=1 Tax=Eleutherodactylus coqui TaxID=57060 RepID=UPI0034624A55